MSRFDHAFLREQARSPSRPRYAAAGPRPHRTPVAAEQIDRALVARVIREARNRAGIPQSEAAVLLGVSPQILCRWELAREPVPPGRRAQIASLYGFDLALITGLDLAAVALTDRESAMLVGFRAWSEPDQDAFLALVRP